MTYMLGRIASSLEWLMEARRSDHEEVIRLLAKFAEMNTQIAATNAQIAAMNRRFRLAGAALAAILAWGANWLDQTGLKALAELIGALK